MTVRRARPGDMPAVMDIRRTVFIEEQSVPEDIERDALDATAVHLVALAEGRPVGTARVLITGGMGKIGRVAVLKPHRGTGLGQALIRFAMDEIRQAGGHTAKLGAQTHALAFYEALGFTAQGAEYSDAGIPHRDMTCPL